MKLQLFLHCTKLYNHRMTQNSRQELDKFSTHRGSWTATRQSADIAVLAAQASNSDWRSSSGKSYYNNNVKTFAWVDVTRSHPYVFGHEVGHIFGCHHDQDTLTATGDRVIHKYGRGLRISGSRMYTIMA